MRSESNVKSHPSKKMKRSMGESHSCTARNYIQCPICQMSIPESFVKSHIAGCKPKIVINRDEPGSMEASAGVEMNASTRGIMLNERLSVPIKSLSDELELKDGPQKPQDDSAFTVLMKVLPHITSSDALLFSPSCAYLILVFLISGPDPNKGCFLSRA